MPTSVQPAEYDMRPPIEYSSRSPITAREARVGCISQSSPLSPAKICASQAPVMQPPADFLPPWHAPPSAKDTSAPPVEPDDATISAMRARMQNVRREIAGLRSKYPELDWTFVGEDLTPPVWPPEMPRARSADPAKSKRSDAPGRTANGGVSPTPRQKGAGVPRRDTKTTTQGGRWLQQGLKGHTRLHQPYPRTLQREMPQQVR